MMGIDSMGTPQRMSKEQCLKPVRGAASHLSRESFPGPLNPDPDIVLKRNCAVPKRYSNVCCGVGHVK